MIEANKFKPFTSGATVGLVSPASPVKSDQQEAAIETLREMGLTPTWGPEQIGPMTYLAGRDLDRATELTAMMTDTDLGGVICYRGGYGSLRTAAHLNFDNLAAGRMPLVGFSDITAILSGLLKAGLQSIHGPAAASLTDQSRESRTRLLDIMAGKWGSVDPLTGTTLSGNEAARGYLVGGNLTVFCHLIGTPWQPPTQGGIFFFEDVGEPLYRIDRCLTHLLTSNALEGITGVAVGRLDGAEPEMEESEVALELVIERLGGLNIPIVAGLPFGHSGDNMSIVVGGRAVIDPVIGQLISEDDE